MYESIDTGSSVPLRPLSELKDSGILWLINRSALHPRGFALTLETSETGEVTGWKILGNGKELWAYQQHNDEEQFSKAEQTLQSLSQEEN